LHRRQHRVDVVVGAELDERIREQLTLAHVRANIEVATPVPLSCTCMGTLSSRCPERAVAPEAQLVGDAAVAWAAGQISRRLQ
jgi:hypothetical protein